MRERRSFGRRTGRREGGFNRGFESRGPSRFGGPRREFQRREEFTEAPVKEGEEYDVEISEVSRRGDGITRIKNFVVFVPNTKSGNKIRIRIKELRGRSAVGEVIEGSKPKEVEEGIAVDEEAEEEGEEEASEEEEVEEGIAVDEEETADSE
jgi:predicted RNA-binding protein with TRAM domain